MSPARCLGLAPHGLETLGHAEHRPGRTSSEVFAGKRSDRTYDTRFTAWTSLSLLEAVGLAPGTDTGSCAGPPSRALASSADERASAARRRVLGQLGKSHQNQDQGKGQQLSPRSGRGLTEHPGPAPCVTSRARTCGVGRGWHHGGGRPHGRQEPGRKRLKWSVRREMEGERWKNLGWPGGVHSFSRDGSL